MPSERLTEIFRQMIYLIMTNQALEKKFVSSGFMSVDLAIRRGADGAILMRSNNPLPAHDSNIVRVILDRARLFGGQAGAGGPDGGRTDRKSTRLNSSH